MIIIRMRDRDLANTRFAYNPLTEVTLSYHLLKAYHSKAHRTTRRHRWADAALPVVDGMQLPYMDAVIDSCRFIPDFVMPPSAGTGLRLEDQLNGLLDVPADLIAEDIQKVADLNGMTDEREQFIKDPHHALPCLVEEIWAYWNAVLTAHWSRISATLDNDVNYRARQLALEGIEAVLKELNEQLESPNRETLIITKSHYDLKTELDGRGIQFYPSLFELGLVWQVGTTWQPSIGYNARGAGLWYEPPAIQTDEAIELTLGASKARLLTALQHPYTTSDLSHLLHVSAGAVSQQLTKLAQAGLVLSHRSGSRVYYRLSPRGAQLLEVFS